jgi:hypothetical protein
MTLVNQRICAPPPSRLMALAPASFASGRVRF